MEEFPRVSKEVFQLEDQHIIQIGEKLQTLSNEDGLLDGVKVKELLSMMNQKEDTDTLKITANMNLKMLTEKYRNKLNGTLERFLTQTE